MWVIKEIKSLLTLKNPGKIITINISYIFININNLVELYYILNNLISNFFIL